MPRPVTVGVDGSPESRAAAEWAAREALRRGLPLRLVHCWNALSAGGPAVRDEEARRRWSDHLLGEAGAELRGRHPGLPVATLQADGSAAAALLSQSGESELLVLGSHGYGAAAGFLRGSVGPQVLSRAPAPVVAVRAQDGRPRDEDAAREVVVGVKGDGARCHALLEFAFGEAALHGASVRAVRAWSVPPVYGCGDAAPHIVHDQQEAERGVLADALAPWREKYPGVRLTVQVEPGARGEVLVRAAAGAALLVVGHRLRRPAVLAHLGPVAHAALHSAHCPVALVPCPCD